MRSVEVSGRTILEAIKKGLAELGVNEEAAETEVLSEPTAGFLGLIGSRQARVRVREKIIPGKYLQEFMQAVLIHLSLPGTIEMETSENVVKINISGDKMGLLIGKRGQTLDALQYLLNVICHRHFAEQGRRVILDVEGYREKREQTLRDLAKRLAQKAIYYRKQVVLEPMSAQERRIIHSTLQDDPAVFTFSQGEEPYRKVVIAPK